MQALSSRRFLSIWLRRLSTDRIARRSPASADEPLVCVADIKSARRITALNDAAARLKLSAGMALTDARAMYPGLAAIDADREADRTLLTAIADWCDRYTPLIGLDLPDGLVLDITGCAHLFGGEGALCRDLSGRLTTHGFHVRLAVAGTVGCAFAVARYGKPGLIASEATRETLMPLPLAALRLPAETVEALAQTGLKFIGDVTELPRAPLAARFGAILLRRLDQAFGREEESIVPLLPLPSYMAERRFPDPIGREDDVLATIDHLAHELQRLLERQGEGARLLQAALFRAEGKVIRIGIGTGEPVREPERICRLFRDRLAALADEYDPGFGFDMVRLCALKTERRDETQTGLNAGADGEAVAHLVDRLGARFGARRVSRLVPQDVHIPEYAAREMSAALALRPSRQARDWDIAPETQDSRAPIRPIRLFEAAEPIEAIAQVPDGPPVRFRWRRLLHEVAQVEGPERIAMQWWRTETGRPLTRDYFRVACRDGLRAWLYREGLYGRELQPGEHPRWYLHGLFA
ncbi:MAG: DNA polymerase Y family protein [Pseudorhodoplanes sp.]